MPEVGRLCHDIVFCLDGIAALGDALEGLEVCSDMPSSDPNGLSALLRTLSSRSTSRLGVVGVDLVGVDLAGGVCSRGVRLPLERAD